MRRAEDKVGWEHLRPLFGLRKFLQSRQGLLKPEVAVRGLPGTRLPQYSCCRVSLPRRGPWGAWPQHKPEGGFQSSAAGAHSVISTPRNWSRGGTFSVLLLHRSVRSSSSVVSVWAFFSGEARKEAASEADRSSLCRSRRWEWACALLPLLHCPFYIHLPPAVALACVGGTDLHF